MDLESMDEEMRLLEARIMADESIESYSASITESSASASITAYKKDGLRTPTQQLADAWNVELKDFSQKCSISVSMGSTTGAASLNTATTKEVNLAADDRESLRQAAEQIAQMMEKTEGVISADSSVRESGTKAQVVIYPEMASAKGFAAQQLSGMIYSNMNGVKAADVMNDGREYEVRVEYPRDYFRTLEDVQSMTFASPYGMSVPITEMAQIRFVSAPQTIVRTDGRFSATVTAVMTEDNADETKDLLQEKIDAMTLPEGVDFLESNMTTQMSEEFRAIGQAFVIALYLVFMVLAVQFESVSYALLIMLCVPFSIIGSVLLMIATGTKISMTALMGLLMLAGIVVNNGIIYIDTANQMRADGEETEEALIHAGKDRLRPILMTTLTTELAMIPVALGVAEGAELMQGMAIVIIGGLFASTVLTLLLIPTFYLLLDRFHRGKYVRQAEERKAL